jgi:hypothetical protein
MKYGLLIAAITLLLANSCKEQVVEEIIDDPAKHNMKFIPDNPGSGDQIKLVIYEDCNYNVLSGIIRNGKIVDIEKQFNGMMKRPCLIQNDTISIGRLSEGIYTVHYKLMDIAPVPPKATLSLTFLLVVSL